MDIRVAGVELGKSAAKFVLLRITENGGGPRIELSESVPHEGNPIADFSAWYASTDLAAPQAVGATRLHADGSPVDERRLNGFAYRLCRSAPRTGAHRSLNVE